MKTGKLLELRNATVVSFDECGCADPEFVKPSQSLGGSYKWCFSKILMLLVNFNEL